METCLGQARPFLTGAGSPPLRGGTSRTRRALRGKPWDHVGEIFSEGCALRVRVVRTDASPGYGMITEERTNGRWPNREMLRSNASLSRGRAEPAPPQGAHRNEDYRGWSRPKAGLLIGEENISFFAVRNLRDPRSGGLSIVF
jgi:hypothetical protein